MGKVWSLDFLGIAHLLITKHSTENPFLVIFTTVLHLRPQEMLSSCDFPFSLLRMFTPPCDSRHGPWFLHDTLDIVSLSEQWGHRV